MSKIDLDWFEMNRAIITSSSPEFFIDCVELENDSLFFAVIWLIGSRCIDIAFGSCGSLFRV